MEKFRKTCDLK